PRPARPARDRRRTTCHRAIGADGLSRRALSFLIAAVVAAWPIQAGAQDLGAAPNAHHEAARIISAELTLQDAASRLQTLAGEKPVGLAETVRHELAIASATFNFRQAARQEELRVYELPGYAGV